MTATCKISPPVQSQQPDRSITRRQWVLLILIFACAIGLRFIWIDDTEPHFDELWHMELSTGRGTAHMQLPHNVLVTDAPALTSLTGAKSWPTIWNSLDAVTHPPLYSMQLRLWRELFGSSLLVARGLSAVAAALAVLVLFDVVRLLHGTRPALWAAAIFTVSSTQIDLAQEVRNYAVTTLLLLLSADALLRIEVFGASIARSAGLFIATFLTLCAHYFAAPILAMLGIYALLRLRSRNRLAATCAMLAALLVFAIAWGPMLLRQRPAFADAGVPGGFGEWDLSGQTARVLQRAAEIPVRQLFEPRKKISIVAPLSAALFVIPWLLLRRRPDLLLWAMWLTAAIGLTATLDLTRGTNHLAQLRHTVFVGPAIVAILATMMAHVRRSLADGLPATILVACVLALGLTYTRDNIRYSLLASHLTEPQFADEPILFYSGSNVPYWCDLFFLGVSHHSGTFPRPVVRLDAPATPELISQLKRWPHVWLVWDRTDLSSDQLVPGTEQISYAYEPRLAGVARLRWVQSGKQ